MLEWTGVTGQTQTTGVPCLRFPLHSRASTWSHNGFLGGGLRRLLPLPALRKDQVRMETSKPSEVGAELALACPFPIQNYPNVLLAHGGGGKLMHQSIN